VLVIIISMSWSIWTVRNSWLFKDEGDPTIGKCKETFKRELLVIHRSRETYVSDMELCFLYSVYFPFLCTYSSFKYLIYFQ
jgi:hypothetical protein